MEKQKGKKISIQYKILFSDTLIINRNKSRKLRCIRKIDNKHRVSIQTREIKNHNV